MTSSRQNWTPLMTTAEPSSANLTSAIKLSLSDVELWPLYFVFHATFLIFFFVSFHSAVTILPCLVYAAIYFFFRDDQKTHMCICTWAVAGNSDAVEYSNPFCGVCTGRRGHMRPSPLRKNSIFIVNFLKNFILLYSGLQESRINKLAITKTSHWIHI